MSRDSSGNYSLPAGNPVATGTPIAIGWANNTLDDIATVLTASLDRSGNGGMLAALEGYAGTLAAPGYCFSSEASLGLYRSSAGVLGVGVGGAAIALFSSTGLAVLAGTAAAPSVSFTTDADTGMYRDAANTLGFATNGVLALSISATAIINALQLSALPGTAAAPGVSFTGDLDTGMSAAVGNTLVLSTGGTARLTLTASAATFAPPVLGPSGDATAPGLGFSTDTDTGLYRQAANTIGFAAGGVSLGILSATVFRPVGVLQGASGDATTPALSFLADSNTGFYNDTADQIGISLGGTTAGQIIKGSFTGTVTGYAANPTGTVEYMIVGNLCMLKVPLAINGTSNATSMTMTGLPAAVRPVSAVDKIPCQLSDNTTTLLGAFSIAAGGATVTFSAGAVVGALVQFSTTGFTNSGTKGLQAGLMLVYSLV